ncbi:hypothetical protein HMPREF9413_1163 [Paenibacillus sp. HGF7]|nr:hypothetical protein HMPREF9413_1163 [Paenibacillus sp. HGF7]
MTARPFVRQACSAVCSRKSKNRISPVQWRNTVFLMSEISRE